MSVRLIQGDCLTEMARLPAGSIDMVLCDLPYGTTACSWDAVIPFEPLWSCYRRVAKPNAAIVLTASQPFTTALIWSNLKEFRYEWIWDKVNRYTGAPMANKRPMKRHENICVFYRDQPTYSPQFREGVPYTTSRPGGGHGAHIGPATGKSRPAKSDGKSAFPGSIIEVKGANGPTPQYHPTQKPVALMEYLIRTYTNPGDTVLDNTCGSGTTLVAAINTGRSAIGIERDPDYFKIAQERVAKAQRAAEPVIDFAAFRRVVEWNARVRARAVA